MSEKVYIDVVVKHTKDGVKIPLYFYWTNDIKYEIDKVLDICKAPVLKTGGHGLRYTCRIMGKEKFLWFEEEKWFLEV